MPEKRKNSGYWQTAAALSPMAAIKGAVDLPEGAIDQYVQTRVAGDTKTPALKLMRQSLSGRGAGRALGHVPFAIATAPLYFSGMKDLRSKDPNERKKGYAKVLGSGALLGGGKGAAEAAIESRKQGPAALKKLIGSRFLSRMGTGLAGSVAVARGVVKGEEERDKGVTGIRKYMYPALGGAAAGAWKGAVDGLVEHGVPRTLTALRKNVVAPGAGRAAAGAIGGAVLGELVHHFKKSYEAHQEKKADFEKIAAEIAAEPPQNDLQIPGMKPGFQLFPHQKRAIERMLANSGTLVLAHGVGSGKTETSIAAQMTLKALGKSQTALVIVPAGLRKNYADRVKKRTKASVEIIGPKNEASSASVGSVKPGKDFYVISYELFRQHPEVAKQVGASTLILDEYHRVRNPSGATYDAIMSVRPTIKNFVGMTGSIVNNDPADIAPLVSMATGNRFMTQQQFKRNFERKVARETGFFGGAKYVVGMQNIPHLQKQIGPYVDYISTEEAAGHKMPTRSISTVNVPMSLQQEEYYKFVLRQLNPVTAWKIRNNVAVSDSEMATVFQQLMKARQISNSLATIDRKISPAQASYLTPKVNKLLDDTARHLKSTPDGQVVIYSNLVHGGVDVVAAGLAARKIPFGIFIGKDREVEGIRSSEQSRTQAVADFQKGKKKVIVLSGAGAEGLDLKNTTMVQTLDGHFNPERILQAEARGRRIGGLMHRPPEQRHVVMKRYVSSIDRDIWDKMLGKKETSVDEYIYNVAGRKASLNRQLQTALKTMPQQKLPDLGATLRETKGPPGVELQKDYRRKYAHRYRTAGGKVVYKYDKGVVA